MNQERDIIKSLWNKIPSAVRICFISGIIAGILFHAYMFTNKLPNWDDINNVGSYAVGAEFGRWFLKYAHLLGEKNPLPYQVLPGFRNPVGNYNSCLYADQ